MGFTPLALVCSRGHNTSIPALLDSPSCELERANDAKHTPLMLCCLAGNEEAMDMLYLVLGIFKQLAKKEPHYQFDCAATLVRIADVARHSGGAEQRAEV